MSVLRSAIAAMLVFAALPAPAAEPLRLIVISDVHVSPAGTVAPTFHSAVARIVERRPRFVVIAGDSTNGNKGDHHSPAAIEKWWKALRSALEPLRKAGIPVLPVAGNHDAYRAAHRQGCNRNRRRREACAGPRRAGALHMESPV